jgi:hypothetical protein
MNVRIMIASPGRRSPDADLNAMTPNAMTPNAMTPNAMTPNAMTANAHHRPKVPR